MDAALSEGPGDASSGDGFVNTQYRCLCGGPCMDHADPAIAPLVCNGRRETREGPNRSSASSIRKPVSSLVASGSQRK